MRGPDIQQDTLFSTVIPEERVPADHPLRPIRQMVNEALADLFGDRIHALGLRTSEPRTEGRSGDDGS